MNLKLVLSIRNDHEINPKFNLLCKHGSNLSFGVERRSRFLQTTPYTIALHMLAAKLKASVIDVMVKITSKSSSICYYEAVDYFFEPVHDY